MPTLVIPKTYANGTVFTEEQLDDIKNSIEIFINSTKLGPDNIQAGAIETSNINSAAVTTPKLANGAVTDSKLASSGVSDADRAVGSNHIKDGAVGTTKIADGAINFSKITPSGIPASSIGGSVVSESSSSGAFSTTTTGVQVPVTNLSISYSPPGSIAKNRIISLVSDGTNVTNEGSDIRCSGGIGYVVFLKDGAVLGKYGVSSFHSGNMSVRDSGNTSNVYSVSVIVPFSQSMTVNKYKLSIYEV